MGELSRWLTLAIAAYDGTVHSKLRQTPAGRWADDLARCGMPPVVANRTAFLVDFLPVIRRKLTRIGFVVDHVHYFTDVLKPWIARRDQLGKFIIRRDPRDISRIWVLDPDGATYIPVPYRNVAHPAVSVWEHRQALERLKKRGIQQVDEAALFRMIDQTRQISDHATKTTRRTRRAAERRRNAPNSTTLRQPGPPSAPPETDIGPAPVPWFDEIEQW
jgi:putative transposase